MKIPGVVCWALVVGIMIGGANAPYLAAQGNNSKLSIEVMVELHKNSRWERVDPQTVFHAGDEIRFRFRASQKGYLYVLNSSSDQRTSWVFPRAGSAERSQIEQGVEYLIPAGQGAFEIGGSPGFDRTYWILAPNPIDSTQSFVPTGGNEASTLQPRCRTEVLRARGLCVDDRAGPQPLRNPLDLPVRAPEREKLHSRDLTFKSQEGTTKISGLTHQSDVVVYEFAIAHD